MYRWPALIRRKAETFIAGHPFLTRQNYQSPSISFPAYILHKQPPCSSKQIKRKEEEEK
uniref:Uncharacterized protein n=1 Tax=Nelumbo nucifera TaxID=4432 RepID=A0A822Z047_NELNU|nr:TPA_asm: hypothetical protein HUJ06_007712 [Nelumbo nucifera]